MVTPGDSKFRKGYEAPFDFHREEANKAIDLAARYLILGYGFNDPHLETHLVSQLKSGKPALLITRSLSQNAKKILQQSKGLIVVCKSEKRDCDTSIFIEKKEITIPDSEIWKLENFLKEVLGHG